MLYEYYTNVSMEKEEFMKLNLFILERIDFDQRYSPLFGFQARMELFLYRVQEAIATIINQSFIDFFREIFPLVLCLFVHNKSSWCGFSEISYAVYCVKNTPKSIFQNEMLFVCSCIYFSNKYELYIFKYDLSASMPDCIKFWWKRATRLLVFERIECDFVGSAQWEM